VSFSLRSSIMAASDVLLPEPVAPTTRISPRFCMISSPSTGGRPRVDSCGICCVMKRTTTAKLPRWRMALIRKRPTPDSGTPMFSSPVSRSSSMRSGGTTSASRFKGASTGSSWLLMGTHSPLILMSAGALADR